MSRIPVPSTRPRLSHALQQMALDETRERIAVRDIVDALAHRSLAGLLFVFALPNALPMPPGTSAVLGAPLVILSAQLMLGLRPWLPNVVASRSMGRDAFSAVIDRSLSWLVRAENLIRPCLSQLASRPYEYVVGGVCLILALLIMLPIPLGNMLPAAAICMFALGILERNGFWILAGTVATVIAAALVWGVVYALVESAAYLLSDAFG